MWMLSGNISLINNSTVTGGWSSSGGNWNIPAEGPNTTRPVISAGYYWDVTASAITNSAMDITLLNSINMTVQCDFYTNCTGTVTLKVLNSSKVVVKQDTKNLTHGNTGDPARYLYPTVNISNLSGSHYIEYELSLVTNENHAIQNYIFVNAIYFN